MLIRGKEPNRKWQESQALAKDLQPAARAAPATRAIKIDPLLLWLGQGHRDERQNAGCGTRCSRWGTASWGGRSGAAPQQN